MARVNLVKPVFLADQHLVAEYDEILMILAYVKKFPETEGIPETYRLGAGHIKFFKNKLVYLKKRHCSLKNEMKSRGFHARKTVSLKAFPKHLCHDWKPNAKNIETIRKRLIEKIKAKPGFYRYYRENKGQRFLLKLCKSATA